MIGICISLITKEPSNQHTVSSVVRDIHQIALSEPNGGRIGSWWICAESINPISGQLLSFSLEFGSILFGAKTARVIVDPDLNSFSIEMNDVVAVRAIRGKDNKSNDDFLLEMASYTIGPISFNEDIVSDSNMTLLEDLAAVSSDNNNAGD